MCKEDDSELFRNPSSTSNSSESSGLFRDSQVTSLERYTKSLNENTQVEVAENDNN